MIIFGSSTSPGSLYFSTNQLLWLFDTTLLSHETFNLIVFSCHMVRRKGNLPHSLSINRCVFSGLQEVNDIQDVLIVYVCSICSGITNCIPLLTIISVVYVMQFYQTFHQISWKQNLVFTCNSCKMLFG